MTRYVAYGYLDDLHGYREKHLCFKIYIIIVLEMRIFEGSSRLKANDLLHKLQIWYKVLHQILCVLSSNVFVYFVLRL